jgi:hypothetical protein
MSKQHSGVMLYVSQNQYYDSHRSECSGNFDVWSEYVSLKKAFEIIIDLHNKLQMMGVPMDNPSSLLCENAAVVINTRLPEHKKKQSTVA